MIERISPQHRIKELLMLINEETPSPEITSELYRVLEAHPEARAYYIERVHLLSDIRGSLREQSGVISPMLLTVMRRAVWRRRMNQALLVVMPLLLVLVGYGTWMNRHLLVAPAPVRQHVAVVSRSFSLNTENPVASFAVGQDLFATDLCALTEEMLEILFLNGTRCIVKGPAEFRLIHSHRLCLQYGEVVVDTVKDTEDFVVEIDGWDVVDIGTRFGVSSQKGGQTEVHVFQGHVELDSGTKREPLLTQEAVVIDMAQEIVERKAASVDQFQQSYPLLEGIDRIEGDIRLAAQPAADLRHDGWTQTDYCNLFFESQLSLEQPCLLSFSQPGVYRENSPREASQLESGTMVRSFMLHYNTPKNYRGRTRCNGTLVFTEKIIGVIVDNELLDTSDALLGIPQVIYATGEDKRGTVEVGDVIEILPDRKTLHFSFQAGPGHLDSLRVLTEVQQKEILDARR